MFDGLDEIDHSIREGYCDQILQIAYQYPKTLLIVSSRPHNRFISWNEFHVGCIEAMNQDQVIELVTTMDYDAGVKQKFLEEVKTRIFESHEEFLSNPLLCTMMLMTFDEFAEITSKMHIFYDQAFNVLYNKHDATKTSFRRTF
jgi:hypothetical protein